MNEYIRREDAVKALGTIEICINLFEDSIEETAVAVDTYAQAADVVPWEWLKRYANGKRMNYCSDFVLEAKEAYENEQDIH